jgi:type I restriction enzyme S subunit
VAGWSYPVLGDICDVRDGTHESPKYIEKGYPLITSKNLTKNGLSFEKISFISKADHDAIEKRSAVSDGDILYGMIGTVGNPVIVKKERDFSVKNVAIFKFIEESLISNKYLFYVLNSDFVTRQIGKESKGGTQKFVSLKVLRGLQIPLPPLDTQKKIAAVLEKADQLRKDCQQMEQELNSLAQSVFIDMFGENLVSPHYLLGDVSNVVSGVTKGQKHVNKVIVKAPYMRVANVQAGYLNLNEIKDIEVKESDVDKYKLEVGDVLLTEGGDHDKLGRGAIWNGEVENCIHQNHVFRVRLDTSLYTSEWLNGYLKTTFAKRYFLKCAKKTTNLASINITQLKGLPMPKIDMNSQEEFERILSVINQQIITNRQVQDEYSEHFNALMQEAFKGELNL